MFGSVKATALEDSKIIEFSADILNEISSDYGGLLKVSRILLETLSKELALTDSLIKWQQYDVGYRIPKATNSHIKLVIHGRIRTCDGKEFIQGETFGIQEAYCLLMVL